MEDLDPPREAAGAANDILTCLRLHGMHYPQPVMYQSHRHSEYDRAIAELDKQGHLFRCDCTRSKLGTNGTCAGNCRNRQTTIEAPFAIRVAVPAHQEIHLHDRVQGEHTWKLGQTLSDFTVKRKDGLYAYQLAVAVDDAAQGITQIVRGSDLLDSTPRQIFLQKLLNMETPHYLHFPVITRRWPQVQ